MFELILVISSFLFCIGLIVVLSTIRCKNTEQLKKQVKLLGMFTLGMLVIITIFMIYVQVLGLDIVMD